MSSGNGLKWMALPEEYSSFDSARFVILPVSYEKDLTYGKGASLGSQAIISASEHLEYYDEQFDCEAFEDGIFLVDTVFASDLEPEQMVETVAKKVYALVSGCESSSDSREGVGSKFFLGLGGDHAVSIGFVKGLEAIHGFDSDDGETNGDSSEGFIVVQIDAHSDYRDSWNGSTLNHACAMRPIAKKHKVLQLGIRSQDKDERRLCDEDPNVWTQYAWEYDLVAFRKKLEELSCSKVYITIDVDGFDPSLISNTGTVEPGGLFWQQVIDILKVCFEMKTVIGADIVEFAPQNDRKEPESYFLARLCYKIMNMAKKHL